MLIAKYPIHIFLLLFVALFAVVFAIFAFLRQVKKGEKISAATFKLDELFKALGGKSNIINTRANMSKIYFKLKDNTIIDPDALRVLGISGIVVNADEVIVILGQRSQEISDIINQELKK